MDRNTAEALIRQYFNGWLQQDLGRVLSALSPAVKVVECYGPVYCGLDEVSRWFVGWHAGDEQGRVRRWEIQKILYDEGQKMAAVEWDFECVYGGKTGAFLGASLIFFDEAKITRIQEYRMEKEQYRPYQA